MATRKKKQNYRQNTMPSPFILVLLLSAFSLLSCYATTSTKSTSKEILRTRKLSVKNYEAHTTASAKSEQTTRNLQASSLESTVSSTSLFGNTTNYGNTMDNHFGTTTGSLFGNNTGSLTPDLSSNPDSESTGSSENIPSSVPVQTVEPSMSIEEIIESSNNSSAITLLKQLAIRVSMWFRDGQLSVSSRRFDFALKTALISTICDRTDLLLVGYDESVPFNEAPSNSFVRICRPDQGSRLLQRTQSILRAEPIKIRINEHTNGSITWATYKMTYEVLAIGETYKEMILKNNPNITATECKALSLETMGETVQGAVNDSIIDGSLDDMLFNLTQRMVYASCFGQELQTIAALMEIDNFDNSSITNDNSAYDDGDVNNNTPLDQPTNASLTDSTVVVTKPHSRKMRTAGFVLTGLISLAVLVLCVMSRKYKRSSERDYLEEKLEKVPKPMQRFDGMVLITPRGVDRILNQTRARSENDTPVSETESARPGTPTHEKQPSPQQDQRKFPYSETLRTPSPNHFMTQYSPRYSPRHSPPGQRQSNLPYQPTLSTPSSVAPSTPRSSGNSVNPFQKFSPIISRRTSSNVPPADVFLTMSP